MLGEAGFLGETSPGEERALKGREPWAPEGLLDTGQGAARPLTSSFTPTGTPTILTDLTGG